MGQCCERCFSECAIREFVQNLNETGDCDYCGSVKVAVGDTSVVGEFMREGLARAYESVDAAGVYWDSDSKSYTAGEYVENIIHDEEILSEMVYAARQESRLVRDLIADSKPGDFDLKDGATDWLDGGAAMLVGRNEFYGADHNRYQSAWEQFKATAQFHNRFFDGEHNGQREALLEPIAEFFPSLTRTLRAGTSFYRARHANGALPREPWETQIALGPPPVSKTANGRMSPPGISYLYLSSRSDTAVAEIRPNVGSLLWLGRFVLKRDVKLLDCTKAPNVSIPSIFDERYHHDMRWIRDFFGRFSTEISQPPTSRDDLLEYVPTQVLAEFIRSKGYDGLRYGSSQKPPGVNITLFCSPPIDSERGYWPARPLFHEWVRLENLSTINVTRAVFRTETHESVSFSEDELKDPDDVTRSEF